MSIFLWIDKEIFSRLNPPIYLVQKGLSRAAIDLVAKQLEARSQKGLELLILL